MSTQLHRSLTMLRVSLHPFLIQESITKCRRRIEGRSEQRGKICSKRKNRKFNRRRNENKCN